MSKRRYEVLLVLDTRGRDESAKEVIERLEKEIAAAGIEIEQVQRLEKRPLAYTNNKIQSGYYVNIVFHGTPDAVAALRGQIKLDPEIYLQHYQRLQPAAQQAA